MGKAGAAHCFKMGRKLHIVLLFAALFFCLVAEPVGAGIRDGSSDRFAMFRSIASELEETKAEGQESRFTVDEKGDPVYITSIPIVELFASVEETKDDTEALLTEQAIAGMKNRKDWFDRQLNHLQKKICRLSLKSAKNGETAFTLRTGKKAISWNALASGISAAMSSDIADYEWVDMGYGRLSQTYKKKGKSFTVTVELDRSVYYDEEVEQSAREKIKEIVSEASVYAKENWPADTRYGMVKYYDEWLCEHNYYNKNGAKTGCKDLAEYHYSHSSYGCLLMGYGVCESYARAMTRLLDAAGIPNYEAIGLARAGDEHSGHAWNLILMSDGKWYLLDSTWNDEGDSSSEEYFLTGEIKSRSANGRYWGRSRIFSYPAVSSEKYSYIK